jgi:hypothetical protein
MATALRNRRGRKRKSRARTPSGKMVRAPAPDFRGMAADQPHRIGLPEALRASELGGSYLGRLQAMKRISSQMREAGERYAFLVSSYYATLPMPQRPHGVLDPGGGTGVDCRDCYPPEICECRDRRTRYMRVYEALAREGRGVVMAVNEAAVRGAPAADIEALARGLAALARYFGLR